MNAKKRILSALNGGRVDRIPAWLPVVPVTVSMMEISRAPWPGSHSDAEQMARLAAMPCELAGLPTATVPFCLSLEAEALGCQLDWGTINRTPSVKKPCATKPDRFDVPGNLLERGRIMTALEAIVILQENLGDKIVINAKVTGPFTIAGHVFGVGNFLSWIKTNPEFVHEAMSRTIDVTKELARAFLAHGADVVSVSDPTSSGDLLSGKYYEEFVFPYHKDVAASIKAPTTLHICGYTKELLPHIRHTGFDGFSFEEKVDVLTAKKLLGDDISLIGNISPVATMLQGTPEKITAEALQCMRNGIDLLSSGCTLSPLTPVENIRALVRAAEEYQLPDGPEERLLEFGRGLAAGRAS
ncbi:MtaA/CmuA family methyltransferase [Methanothrix soehngenii]|jgi:MtaA/CmuA family methyltransferase|uniref:MtaA/CmuA family methyltransferase n=1 Tax=Methanothrix soehngenii TaxID=2223 RepID=UPI0023F51E6D|nr:MtaA/CmuA family methyltransferase [Methanothrix soehngenii]